MPRASLPLSLDLRGTEAEAAGEPGSAWEHSRLRGACLWGRQVSPPAGSLGRARRAAPQRGAGCSGHTPGAGLGSGPC